MNNYWVSETNVWKIYANSEAEARQVWEAYCETGDSSGLDMKLKEVEVDADWEEAKQVEVDADWEQA